MQEGMSIYSLCLTKLPFTGVAAPPYYVLHPGGGHSWKSSPDNGSFFPCLGLSLHLYSGSTLTCRNIISSIMKPFKGFFRSQKIMKTFGFSLSLKKAKKKFTSRETRSHFLCSRTILKAAEANGFRKPSQGTTLNHIHRWKT